MRSRVLYNDLSLTLPLKPSCASNSVGYTSRIRLIATQFDGLLYTNTLAHSLRSFALPDTPSNKKSKNLYESLTLSITATLPNEKVMLFMFSPRIHDA